MHGNHITLKATKECAILQIPWLGEAGRSNSIFGPALIETTSCSKLQNITNIRRIFPRDGLPPAWLRIMIRHQPLMLHNSKYLLHRRTLYLHPQSVTSHHGGKLSRKMQGEKRKKVSLLFCYLNTLYFCDPEAASSSRAFEGYPICGWRKISSSGQA